MSRARLRWTLAAAAALGAGAVAAPVVLRDAWARAWVKAHAPNVFQRTETLDARRARVLFDLDRVGHQVRYDPVAWLTLRPNLEQTYPWPEHPAGEIVLRTNDLGLREDAPVASEKRSPRVLVTGDSHTAGLVPNAETFAGVLETRLGAHGDWSGVEVLNAGVPYTGPACYRRTLEKRLELQPDVVVAVCFTGNDFWDELEADYLLDGWTPPSGDAAYRERIESVAARWPGPASQGFNQAFRFAHFPWEPERALELARTSFRAMQARCDELGLRLVVVVLPTKMDAEPGDDRETQEAVRTALDLTPEQLAVNATLGARLAAALRAAGIECLDPLETMRTAPHPLYWRQDYHLATSGHALLGAELERVLAGGR
jgi:hypothetical protein